MHAGAVRPQHGRLHGPRAAGGSGPHACNARKTRAELVTIARKGREWARNRSVRSSEGAAVDADLCVLHPRTATIRERPQFLAALRKPRARVWARRGSDACSRMSPRPGCSEVGGAGSRCDARDMRPAEWRRVGGGAHVRRRRAHCSCCMHHACCRARGKQPETDLRYGDTLTHAI